MADTTIQGLPAGSALGTNDLFVIDQYLAGLYNTKKITGTQLANFIRAQQYYKTIQDGSSTAYTQRAVLQFNSGFVVSDDSSDGITIIEIDPSAVMMRASFIDKEVPTGVKDSANLIFTLASTPVVGSEHVFLNGMLLQSGAGGDYTISGSTITFNIAPDAIDKLVVTYRK